MTAAAERANVVLECRGAGRVVLDAGQDDTAERIRDQHDECDGEQQPQEEARLGQRSRQQSSAPLPKFVIHRGTL